MRDPEVQRWLPDLPPVPVAASDPETPNIGVPCRVLAASSSRDFLIVEHASGTLLGSIAIGTPRLADERREVALGYWLRSSARGRGLATEALGLTARWLLDRRSVDTVEVFVNEQNPRAACVAERSGFRRDRACAGMVRYIYGDAPPPSR